MAEEAAPKHIAFVLFPGLTPLDLIGPLQVLNGLAGATPYRPVVVAERLEPIPTDTPLQLVPDATLADVPNPFAVIVPGAGLPIIRALGNTAIHDYVCSVAPTAEIVGSVCTGALILAAAGLLEGRQATTHWGFQRMLEKLGARYVRRRWVEDGKFVTAAGVSAGIDMALYLAARLAGQDIGKQLQLSIEYDPEPPFGPIDWQGVDRDMLDSVLEQAVRADLAGRPDLVQRLAG